MAKLTADTITDEHIRELHAEATNPNTLWKWLADTCDVALYDLHSVGADRRRAEARARCAEILNARNGDAPGGGE